MRIEVNIDATNLLRRMERGEKRVAYATVNAINATAARIQQAEFARVRSEFMVRKPDFFFGTPQRPGGAAARVRRASVGKERPDAEIWAGASSQASARRLLLPMFEKGGVRPPFTAGARRVAVPLLGRPARPNWARGVPPEYTWSGMHLVAYRGKRRISYANRHRKSNDVTTFGEYGRLQLPDNGSALQWKGRNRTFLLTRTRNDPDGAVFQRYGPKRGDIREIWALIEPPQLDARLGFVSTAELTAARWFAEELDTAIKAELAHAARKEQLL